MDYLNPRDGVTSEARDHDSDIRYTHLDHDIAEQNVSE